MNPKHMDLFQCRRKPSRLLFTDSGHKNKNYPKSYKYGQNIKHQMSIRRQCEQEILRHSLTPKHILKENGTLLITKMEQMKIQKYYSSTKIYKYARNKLNNTKVNIIIRFTLKQ